MKKKLIITSALLTGIVLGGFHLTQGKADEIPPIVQEVQHQGEVLQNHEGRITNTENDVKDLQNNTNTPPSPTNTVVKEVQIPSPDKPLYTPPVPPKILVIQATQRIEKGGHEYCDLIYSDGSKASKYLGQTIDAVNPDYPYIPDKCGQFLGDLKP